MQIKRGNKYYQRQIDGLMLILDDHESMISKDYVMEKLVDISNGNGINFHPEIEAALDRKWGTKLVESKSKFYDGEVR